MKSLPYFLLTGLLAALPSGCYTPQFMPAADIECRVFDESSKTPIAGAEMFMVYVGASGQTVKKGPFLTDQNGIGRIAVAREAIWQSGAETGFSGGYLRHIEVHAIGYKETGYWENFDRGQLDKKSPFTFYLKK